MAADGESPQFRWTHKTARIWILHDDSGSSVREVAEVGDLNTPVKYNVSGPNYESTDHSSLGEAMAAARASLTRA